MSKGQKGVIVVLVIMALIGVGIGGAYLGQLSVDQPVITHVEQVFVDIDGDGKLDLVLKADVVLNTGNQNLAVSQLSNP